MCCVNILLKPSYWIRQRLRSYNSFHRFHGTGIAVLRRNGRINERNEYDIVDGNRRKWFYGIVEFLARRYQRRGLDDDDGSCHSQGTWQRNFQVRILELGNLWSLSSARSIEIRQATRFALSIHSASNFRQYEYHFPSTQPRIAYCL